MYLNQTLNTTRLVCSPNCIGKSWGKEGKGHKGRKWGEKAFSFSILFLLLDKSFHKSMIQIEPKSLRSCWQHSMEEVVGT